MTAVVQNDDGTRDIEIDYGTDVSIRGEFEDKDGDSIDISNWDFELLVVDEWDSQQQVFYRMTVSNGRISVVDAKDGVIELRLTASETSNLPFDEKPYVFYYRDEDGLRKRLAKGLIDVQ